MRLYGFWRSHRHLSGPVALNLLRGSSMRRSISTLLLRAGKQHYESFGAVNPAPFGPRAGDRGRTDPHPSRCRILEAHGHALSAGAGLFSEPNRSSAHAAVGLPRARYHRGNSHPLVVPRVRRRLTQQFGGRRRRPVEAVSLRAFPVPADFLDDGGRAPLCGSRHGLRHGRTRAPGVGGRTSPSRRHLVSCGVLRGGQPHA